MSLFRESKMLGGGRSFLEEQVRDGDGNPHTGSMTERNTTARSPVAECTNAASAPAVLSGPLADLRGDLAAAFRRRWMLGEQ